MSEIPGGALPVLGPVVDDVVWVLQDGIAYRLAPWMLRLACEHAVPEVKIHCDVDFGPTYGKVVICLLRKGHAGRHMALSGSGTVKEAWPERSQEPHYTTFSPKA